MLGVLVLSHLVVSDSAILWTVDCGLSPACGLSYKGSPRIVEWVAYLSVHGISLARVLEWVAMHSSRGSSWPRD